MTHTNDHTNEARTTTSAPNDTAPTRAENRMTTSTPNPNPAENHVTAPSQTHHHPHTTCHIVFHTHWDREWYFPFEQFRHRLLTVMDRIIHGLEAGEIKAFVMDGQMAALEDYLDVCEPDKKQRVQKLIETNKIIIGPWYVLADEFLVAGESLIRNLEIGHKLANQYGAPQRIGYLPDTFGHIGQMPQILQGFSIDNAILARGLNAQASELYWQAPDGSEVLTIFLPEGYYQPVLDDANYETATTQYFDKIKRYATTSQLLLTYGGDHLMPGYGDVDEKINKLQLHPSTYEAYLEAVKRELPLELSVHKGEMRNNEHLYVLPNVLSTRSYLKEQNQRIEDVLTGYIEPLFALCAQADYPAVYIEDTWKLLLQNHPHDSICGCSVDDVHDEMEIRTKRLEQRMSMLEHQALQAAGYRDDAMSGRGLRKPFDDCATFALFNPHPVPFTGWVQGRVWRHDDKSFILQDDSGNKIVPTILSQSTGRVFESPVDAFPEFKQATFYDIAIHVKNVPALSLSSFTMIDGEPKELTMEPQAENEYIKLNIERDGTLTLFDKAKQQEYKRLMQFYSTLDAGDEYNYSPPVNDQKTIARLMGEPIIHSNNNVSVVRYTLGMQQPASLNEDRTGPSATTVKSLIDVMLTVTGKRVKVSVTVTNRAKDQRLRVTYPLVTKPDFTYSDTAFEIVKRPAVTAEQFDAPKQKEVPVVVEPSQSFIHVDDLTFYHRGLQEYQVYENSLDITVLRSVGWLSRDDLRTRGGGAGPNMETPGGQCMGTYTFDFAFELERKQLAEVATEAKMFRVPPKFVEAHVPTPVSLFEIDNRTLQWSTIRRKHDHVEVRLWNPCESDENVNFLCPHPIVKTQLNGDVMQRLFDNSDTIKGHEIATYVILTEGAV
ncbi:glycoside hydrolase family 38 [Bacillus sp. HMF5848]|uniref:alpha-mannosidase n=1 Tax=Bacillus sp. HMF5848 TaxID=2495421 RepID=UPI000F7B2DC2|nr:glycoside hydrolase family 38 C-terminal domain-containing protein [Bacillus sp. HMF5848]RSK28872.1 glycoside hydrolase family 38 [Bacillus sp. HMF5848]